MPTSLSPSSSSSVPTSIAARCDEWLLKWERGIALVSGSTVFVMVLLAVFSVSGRNIFNRPISGYVDWIEQAMPLIAFLGMAWVQRQGGHVRMDLLVGRLRGRLLWVTEIAGVFAMLALTVLLIWGSYAHFARSFDLTAPLWSRDSSMDIALPLWPAKLLAPIAFTTLFLRLCLQLWGYGRLILGMPAQVMLPTIESTVDLARREADVVGLDISASGAVDAQNAPPDRTLGNP